MTTILNPYYVYVNSHNRIAGTDSNFTYNIEFPPDAQFDRVTVLDALVPKSYYLIQENHNYFSLQEGDTVVIVYVPAGNYYLNALKNVLGTLLTEASPNGWVYTVTYPSSTGADTGKFTYHVTGNTSQPSIIVQDHVYEPLGFERNTTNVFVDDTLESTSLLKLQSEDRLLLHSNIVNNLGQDDILVSINASTSVNFSSIAYINYAPAFNSKTLNAGKNSYRFTFLNEDGREMNFHGLNCNFTLCCYKQGNPAQQIADFIRLLAEK